MKRIITILLGTVMALALTACGSTGTTTDASEGTTDTVSSAVTSEAKDTAEKPDTSTGAAEEADKSEKTSDDVEGITAEKYEKIENGMSYEDVKGIIGTDGENVSSSDVAGVTTAIYQWKSGNFGTAMVTFQNDAVTGKSQFGVSEQSDVTVSAAQYDKIETGMTYDEVKEILGGDGQSLSETEIAGQTAEMYSWSGSSLGSNCTISFGNGKVTAKSQVGLQ